MKHVILIEDDPAIRDSLSVFFRMKGVAFTAYQDGDFVLEGGYEYPDLFLIDKQLSGIDGLDLCRYLKSQQQTKHIPVVMISASPDIIPLARSVCADDALVKPYELSDLKDMVLKYL